MPRCTMPSSRDAIGLHANGPRISGAYLSIDSAHLWLGRGMCYYIAHTMQSDLFRVPVVLAPQTYAFAVTVVLFSALLSGLAVRRRLDQLDLIAVLKAAE